MIKGEIAVPSKAQLALRPGAASCSHPHDSLPLHFCTRRQAGRSCLVPREPFFLKSEDLPSSRKINSERPSPEKEDTGSQSSTKGTGDGHPSPRAAREEGERRTPSWCIRHSRGTSCSTGRCCLAGTVKAARKRGDSSCQKRTTVSELMRSTNSV